MGLELLIWYKRLNPVLNDLRSLLSYEGLHMLANLGTKAKNGSTCLQSQHSEAEAEGEALRTIWATQCLEDFR